MFIVRSAYIEHGRRITEIYLMMSFGFQSDRPISKPIERLFAYRGTGLRVPFPFHAFDDILQSACSRHRPGSGSGVEVQQHAHDFYFELRVRCTHVPRAVREMCCGARRVALFCGRFWTPLSSSNTATVVMHLRRKRCHYAKVRWRTVVPSSCFRNASLTLSIFVRKCLNPGNENAVGGKPCSAFWRRLVPWT